jgi:hypothetical protein
VPVVEEISQAVAASSLEVVEVAEVDLGRQVVQARGRKRETAKAGVPAQPSAVGFLAFAVGAAATAAQSTVFLVLWAPALALMALAPAWE